MDGLYVKHKSESSPLTFGKCELDLVFKHEGFEIVTQKLDPESLIWITPAESSDSVEFYYVLSGRVAIISKSKSQILEAGDCFYVEALSDELKLDVLEPTTLLCFTNTPSFDELISFEGNLHDLLMKINEKDPYTYQHGKNVMEYSVKLMEALHGDKLCLERIGIAALFHDIGKYYVPEEILKKREGLSAKELYYIRKHPIDTKRLLEKRFGSVVAEIAEGHHERLDGSGYPYSLKGDAISLESRIISIADTFDAMTTQRPYNIPKGFKESIAEMLTLTHLYDERVLHTFEKLIYDKIICDFDECV